jgi:hypothetical protein
MDDKDKPSFAPPGEPDDTADEEEDFVFRFRLDQPASDEAACDDPLIELIRGQLADLLDAVILTHHGKRVRVDGFRLLQDPDTQHDIFPRPQDQQPEESDGAPG